jgi:branched-subunit amino acid transport protein
MSLTAVALTILGMGLITYAIRLSMFLLMGRFPLPPGLLRALRYVPAAVLSAIIFPDVLLLDGTLAITPANPRLLAALAGALVAWRSHNVFLTVLAGMVTYWLVVFILGV